MPTQFKRIDDKDRIVHPLGHLTDSAQSRMRQKYGRLAERFQYVVINNQVRKIEE